MDRKQDKFFLTSRKEKKHNIQEAKENFRKKRQENADKNRPITEDRNEPKEKKPFDKKAYRLKKYSKKYKLDQWEEQRKKKVLRNYHKELKKDSLSGSYKPITFDNVDNDGRVNDTDAGRFVKHPDLLAETESKTDAKQNEKKPIQNKDPFWKAKEHYRKLQQEKLDKKTEIERAKEERKVKLQEYKKQKQERFKKISKKTKKGQPVMTGRLELLLEKIQGSK